MRATRSRLCSARIVGLAAAAALVLSGCVIGATGDPHFATDTSVDLSGTLVSTASEPATYWFEYGPTTDYGSHTTPANVVVNQPSTSVSTTVTGLTPGTLYHYRLCDDAVTDSLPSSCGADRTVSTGIGRVSVTGGWTDTVIFNFYQFRQMTYSLRVVGDAPGPGYADGTFTLEDKTVFKNEVLGDFFSTTPVVCLRVAGTLATVGIGATQLLVIDDSGPTTGGGDHYVWTSRPSGSPCPAPDASLLGPHPSTGSFTMQPAG